MSSKARRPTAARKKRAVVAATSKGKSRGRRLQPVSAEDEDALIQRLEQKIGKRTTGERMDGLDDILKGLGQDSDSEDQVGYLSGDDQVSEDDDTVDYRDDDDTVDYRDDDDTVDYRDDDDIVDYRDDDDEEDEYHSDDEQAQYSDDNDEEESEDDGEQERASEEGPSSGSVYVAPHMRRAQRGQLEGLDRQVRGLLNKVSRANFDSILEALAGLAKEYSRGDMFEALTATMLNNCVQQSTSTGHSSFTIAYASLVAGLFHRLGMDVGGRLLDQLVPTFQRIYDRQQAAEAQPDNDDDDDDDDETVIAKRKGRNEASNLVLLLIHLFNFGVLHYDLLLDLIRLLLQQFSALDVELLLLIIRFGGLALRSEAARAFADVLSAVEAAAKQRYGDKKKAATAGQDEANSRVGYMIDSILDLRHNKRRMVAQSDEVQHYKTVLQALKRGSSNPPLRISWQDVLSGNKGRWWMVGSAYQQGSAVASSSSSSSSSAASSSNSATDLVLADATSQKILRLAQAQHMNTDVRRAVFCILLSSEDYVDCFVKLMQLNLKGKQDRDIVQVLLHCLLMERHYNPYYQLLASKLCSFQSNYKFTFQFAIWDRYKDPASIAKPDKLPAKLLILGQFVAGLVNDASLSLTVFKVVEWAAMSASQRLFVRCFLAALLTAAPPDADAGAGTGSANADQHAVKLIKRIAKDERLLDLVVGLKEFLGDFRSFTRSQSNLLTVLPAVTDETRDLLRKRLRIARAVLSKTVFD